MAKPNLFVCVCERERIETPKAANRKEKREIITLSTALC